VLTASSPYSGVCGRGKGGKKVLSVAPFLPNLIHTKGGGESCRCAQSARSFISFPRLLDKREGGTLSPNIPRRLSSRFAPGCQKRGKGKKRKKRGRKKGGVEHAGGSPATRSYLVDIGDGEQEEEKKKKRKGRFPRVGSRSRTPLFYAGVWEREGKKEEKKGRGGVKVAVLRYGYSDVSVFLVGAPEEEKREGGGGKGGKNSSLP